MLVADEESTCEPDKGREPVGEHHPSSKMIGKDLGKRSGKSGLSRKPSMFLDGDGKDLTN